MKKAAIVLLMLTVFTTIAQNVQLHYDFGRADDHGTSIERNYVTSTFEFFKPDTLGSTFAFIDLDFAKGNGGISMAYTEISRKFTLHKKSGLSLQLEYNDGSPVFIKPAYLAGVSYPIKIGKVIFHTSLLYKAYQKAKSPDGQFTIVWNHMLLKNRLFLSGFVDIWTQDNFAGNGKDVVILTEPQLWYCLGNKLKIGTEIEISQNFFIFDNNFKVMPTIACRWDF